MTAVQYDPLPPKPRRPGSPAATLRRWRPTRRTLRWTWPLLLALLLGRWAGWRSPRPSTCEGRLARQLHPSLGTQLYDKNGHAFAPSPANGG